MSSNMMLQKQNAGIVANIRIIVAKAHLKLSFETQKG
jgi:hypothetical protein